MFIQIIEGHVSDSAALKAAIEDWRTRVAPGTDGWLGSTGGVTADGKFISFVRFESEEAAERSAARPEQDAWWTQTAQLFEGDVSFVNSSDIVTDIAGDPDQAGFVQVIKGQSKDPRRAAELMTENPEVWKEFRPDVIGSCAVNLDDGQYIMAIYFTSEAEAREGEKKEAPEEMRAAMEEMQSLEIGVPTFLDLTDPWIASP